MDFKKLLENKVILYSIIGGVIVLLFLILVIGISVNSNKTGTRAQAIAEKIVKEPLDLLTTDNLGKAIEIQALLAREDINAKRRVDGTKSTIFLVDYTQSQRDRALLAIVKSGLMDQNIGLEIFDKGDFTSTKEDKRIRLARAINGELSRLIRKIPPIENASVFVSIPEQTMFSSMKKPVTATVQVVIPSGDKLDQNKIRAITNLLLGSVTGLESENISITDTNGNVYSSIISAGDDMLAKIEEQDNYMKTKVCTQLDKLVGKGKYAATVSTFLRQAPKETTKIGYDPESKTALSEQVFSEGLGDQTKDTNKGLNAVSVYLPNGLPATSADSAQNRSYSRTAREVQYGISKVQETEYSKMGTIEEISIAITIDENAIPENITQDELKELVARAASPKVNPENVTIAYSDNIDPYLASDRPSALPKPDETGNPWWLALLLVAGGLFGGWKILNKKIKKEQQKQQEELAVLREKAEIQDKQLRDVNLKAAELIEKQAQMQQGMIEQKAQVQTLPQNDELISEMTSEINLSDDDEVIDKVKSWIERP